MKWNIFTFPYRFDIDICFAGWEGIHVAARLKMVPQKMSSS
jgi:hypothetical protein